MDHPCAPSILRFINDAWNISIQHGYSADSIFKRAKLCDIFPTVIHAVHDNTPKMRDLRARCRKQQTLKLALWHASFDKIAAALKKEYILLKGPPLSERLTGSELWRETADIDIWIQENDLQECIQNLENIGFCAEENTHKWATNQLLMRHHSLVPVELHWNLAPHPWVTPDFCSALNRSRQTTLKNVSVRILGDADLWIHLLIHAHQHYFAPKTLIDLCGGIDRISPDVRLIHDCRLNRLDRFARISLAAFTGAHYHAIREKCLANLSKAVLVHTLEHGFGPLGSELVFGRTSQCEAAAGVLIRAASMALLDGWLYPGKAAADVLFLGPHPLGQMIHKILS